MVVEDATKAADLILARRVWVVAVRNDNRNNDGKKGDSPVPNYAAAGGGRDNDGALSPDNDAIGGCLCMLNKQTTSLRGIYCREARALD